MCGFTGIFHSRDKREIDMALLARMNDSLAHRGPDDCGYHTEPGIGLGHRRLSIIDLSGGHQPMFNEDGSVAVVYNGEIYNFQELIKELREAGHRFRTSCDTEVIVHAWEEWGADCVKRFRGMFAFALWDQNQETLFLARDRLGIKPLYYSVLADGTVLFGSELKALLQHPDLPRNIDPRAVEDYFAYGYVPDPKTIYRDVAKLAPAHHLTFRRNEPLPTPRSYWDLSFEAREGLTEAQACEELVELLREAVGIRMIADVPLGAFLSGGVDSSSVVAMMAGLSSNPVESFSIGFDQANYDETHFAAEVAKAHKTRHHLRKVNANEFDLVDRLAGIYDEPFADSSAIPTFRLSSVTREHVTVALSGDGGDEVLAGYRRYRWHHYEEQVRARVPQSIRGPLFGLLGNLYPKMDWAPQPFRAKSTFQALARDSLGGYFHSVSMVADDLRQKLYSSSMRRHLQGYHAGEVLKRYMENAPVEDHLSRVQYVDLKTYLPGDILTKVDRASMANSLEVRVPFLDHHFVEWAARIPAKLRLNGREGKYVLKKAMEAHLPSNVLYRKKMGFAVPLTAWFRGPLRERVKSSLSGDVLADSGYFDMTSIAGLVDQHQAGLRDHSAVIWALVMFESFLRQVHCKTADQTNFGK
ncbi:MAG: amidotransferase 1, exosortase A system-associated [Planctomycetes bacterium]|nr:amidotransferase 1, exosortase A system-associated [Planctomycetota bacterium]